MAKEKQNTLQSNQILRLIEVLGEGPIESVEQVYLNETALTDEEGNENFSGVDVAYRLGTPDQDPVPGFTNQESDEVFDIQVLKDTPITQTITNPDTDAARVVVKLPALYRYKSNGDMLGWDVSYNIEYRPSGGVWTEVEGAPFEWWDEKCTSPVFLAHRFPLTGSAPWEIRVTRTKDDNTDSRAQNDTYFYSLAEIIEQKISYRNTAYMAITANAEEFGGQVPPRAAYVKGLICEVPTNFDPITRTYSGIWDGTWKWAWTDCPAWCLRNLILNKRYGLGRYVKREYLDATTLYAISAYCAEHVDDGNGGTEPRFTFNAVIQDRQEAYDVVNAVASVFRGMVYWSLGMAMFVQDAPKDPVLTVTRANTVNGEFSYSGSALTAVHNRINVTYNNLENFGKRDVVTVEDPDHIIKHGPRPKDIVAFGCTSKGQAWRAGRWLLYTERMESDVLTYVGGQDHVDVLPGSVIRVSDPSRHGQELGGRLAAYGTNTVTLDREVTLEVGEEYELVVHDRERALHYRTVTSAPGALTTLTLDVVLPELTEEPRETVWALRKTSAPDQLYRVLSSREVGQHQYEVTALFHAEDKFALIENGERIPANPLPLLPTGPLPVPLNLDANEQVTEQSGTSNQTAIVVSFTRDTDPRVRGVALEYRRKGQNWQTVDLRMQLSYLLTGAVAEEKYQFRARSYDALGNYSAYTSVYNMSPSDRLEADALPGVSNTTIDAAFKAIVLRWTNPDKADFKAVEIYSSTDNVLANATLIATVSGSAYTHDGLPVDLQRHYWTRCVFHGATLAYGTTDYFGEATTLSVGAGEIGTGAVDGDQLAQTLSDYIDGAVTTADQAVADAEQAAADAAAVQSNLDSAVAELQVDYDATSQAAADAQTARDAAELARDAAALSEANAESAQALAESAQTGAESAKTASESARDTAQTAATNADTAKTGAESARDQADTILTNTGLVRDAAVDAKTASELARDAAQTAQGAAETAETNAGNAASLAGDERTAAETAKDTAVQAANNAATAQGLAETAQGASETAQGLAEAARDAAQSAETGAAASSSDALEASVAAGSKATGNMIPVGTFDHAPNRNFNEYFSAAEVVDIPAAADPHPEGYDRVLLQDYRDNVFYPSIGEVNYPFSPAGRRFRITGWVFNASEDRVQFGVNGQNAAGSSQWHGKQVAPANSNEWVEFSVDIDGNAIDHFVNFRPWSQIDGAQGTAYMETYWVGLRFEDVTESYAAGQSAAAAVTSEANAAASATEAGEEAIAANTAKVAAETAQSNAETAETNAATSASNALGSESAAASSSVVAATAQRRAQEAAVGNLVRDGGFEVTPLDWVSHTSGIIVNRYDHTGTEPPTDYSIRIRINDNFSIGSTAWARQEMEHPLTCEADRTLRVTGWVYNNNAGDARVGVRRVDSQGTYHDFRSTVVREDNTSGAWLPFDVLIPIPGDGSVVHAIVVGSELPNTTVSCYFTALSVTDVTEQVAAETAANAAAISESNAAASATTAGEEAASATTAKNLAETAQANAESAETSAATSASNAAGSEAAAASSETVSANASRETAQRAGDNILPLSAVEDDTVDYDGTYLTGNIEVVDTIPAGHPLGRTRAIKQTERPGYIAISQDDPWVQGSLAGRIFKVSCYVYNASTAQARFGMHYKRADGTSSWPTGANAAAEANTNEWTYFEQDMEFGDPHDSVRWQGWIHVNGNSANGDTFEAYWTDLRIEDVTDQRRASQSANAAATSASNAEASNTAAGQSASAAQSAQTAAETARSGAESAQTQAANSATTAAGSASAAGTSETNAANSATAAGDSASAASTSESNAASSATTAGQQATAAQASAVIATTAKDTTVQLAGNPVFALEGEGFASYAGWNPSAEHTGFNYGTEIADPVTGGRAYNFAQGTIQFLDLVPFDPARTYRMTVRIRANTSGCVIHYGFMRYDAQGVGVELGGNNRYWAWSSSPVAQGDWVEYTFEFGADATSVADGTALIRPVFLANYNKSGQSMDIDEFRLEDITESTRAEGSATAAATSASQASASETAAGEEATAAQTARTGAETAQAGAETAESNAATSASNASSSEAAAATSSSLSARAQQRAENAPMGRGIIAPQYIIDASDYAIAAYQDGTEVFRNGAPLVTLDRGDLSTHTLAVGDRITATGPVGIVNGESHTAVPEVLAGTQFFTYYDRNTPVTVTVVPLASGRYRFIEQQFSGGIYTALQSEAWADMVEGVPFTITLGSVLSAAHVLIETTAPVVAGRRSSGADRDAMLPAHPEVMVRSGGNYAAFGPDNSIVVTDFPYVYSSDGVTPVGIAAYADGNGTDCEAAMPVPAMGDTFVLAQGTLKDYKFMALETTTVTVTDKDGTVLGEHLVDCSSAPGAVEVGLQAGNGTNISTNGPFYFSAPGAFALRTNVNTYEYAAVGFQRKYLGTDASGAADATVVNAATATAKADEAGEAATAAQTAQTAAETARGGAETAQTAASNSATAADGSASDAALSATAAANSATEAGDSASAASTSESNAATSASNAGTSASAAQTARTGAETAQGAAATSASNAATSESNAAGSANAASATQAVTAEIMKAAGSGNLWPQGTFDDAELFGWIQGSIVVDPITGSGNVLNNTTGGSDIHPQPEYNSAGDPRGRVFRIRGAVYNPGANTANVWVRRFAPDGSNLGQFNTQTVGAAGGTDWVAFDYEYVYPTGDLSGTEIASYHFFLQHGGGSVADNSQAHWKALSVEDITESYHAEQSASAAATSASNASASETAAGQEASAAQDERVLAETARSGAETAESNAATSASNALGSESAAATSASVSASASKRAQEAAVGDLIADGDFAEGGLLWEQWTIGLQRTRHNHGSNKPDADFSLRLEALDTLTFDGSISWVRQAANQALKTLRGPRTMRVTGWSQSQNCGDAFFTLRRVNDDNTLKDYLQVQIATGGVNWAWFDVTVEIPDDDAKVESLLIGGIFDAEGDALYLTQLSLEDVTESTLAEGYANAASTSASAAAASATEAGEEASAASTARDAAETAQSNAEAAESSAAQSASDALGSSAAASSSETLAARASWKASNAANGNLIWKHTYEDGVKGGWTSGQVVDVPAAHPLGRTKAVKITTRDTYYWVDPAQLSGDTFFDTDLTGRTLRFTGWVYNLSDVQARAGINYRNASNQNNWPTDLCADPNSGEWVFYDFTLTFSSGYPGVKWRPFFQLNGTTGTDYMETYWTDVSIEDVTESTSAELSASAAATSASNADASATDAGQQASAAQTARTGAETARSGAESAQTAAVSAKDTAVSSASSAGTSATNAANSATAAGDSADAAAVSESNAATSASDAGVQAAAADASRIAAEAAYQDTVLQSTLPDRWLENGGLYQGGVDTGWEPASVGKVNDTSVVLSPTNTGNYPTIANNLIPVLAGEAYSWGMWVRNDDTSGATPQFGAPGSGGWMRSSIPANTGGAWVWIQGSGVAPGDRNSLTLELRSPSSNLNGNLYVDGLVMVRGIHDLSTMSIDDSPASFAAAAVDSVNEASGFADAASAQASAAATQAVTAQAALEAVTLVNGNPFFALGTEGWYSSNGWNGNFGADLTGWTSDATETADPVTGERAYTFTGINTLESPHRYTMDPARTYRIRARVRSSGAAGSDTIYVGGFVWQADGSPATGTTAHRRWFTGPTTLTPGVWTEFEFVFAHAGQLHDLNADVAYFQPALLINYNQDTSDYVIDVDELSLEDITERVAAEESASAASISASNALASEDAAGQSATAASTAKDQAETARSGAESAESSAADSATDALGSASLAAASESVTAWTKLRVENAERGRGTISPLHVTFSDNYLLTAYQDDTKVYRNGVYRLTLDRGEMVGSLWHDAGDVVTATGPLAVSNAKSLQMTPEAFAGQLFYTFYSRYQPISINVVPLASGKYRYVDVSSSITDLKTELDGAAWVDMAEGVPFTIVTQSDGSTSQFMMETTGPVVVSRTTGSGDHDSIPPMWPEVLWEGSSSIAVYGGAGYDASGDPLLVGNERQPVMTVRIGDGQGSDCDHAMPVSFCGDTYIIAEDHLDDYWIAATEETVVQVTDKDGLVLGEHTIGSESAPGAFQFGYSSGSTYEGRLENGPFFVTGNKPFALRTNNGTDREYMVYGFQRAFLGSDARGTAFAAAESASAASASETAAGESASAALTSETNAGTSESNAATSEGNAAVSESNASGSASAALGYSEYSARAGAAAVLRGSGNYLPVSTVEDGSIDYSVWLAGTQAVADAPAGHPLGRTKAIKQTERHGYMPLSEDNDYRYDDIAGRTFRISGYCYNASTVTAAAGITFYDTQGGNNWPVISSIPANSNQWVYYDELLTISPNEDIANWRGWLFISGYWSNGDTLEAYWTDIRIEDVTERVDAEAAASAASLSESNAAASEDNAGQSASAAALSESNANTSAGNALTSEGNAATSAANALGSENNASSYERLAAISRRAAALKNLVPEPNANDYSTSGLPMDFWHGTAVQSHTTDVPSAVAAGTRTIRVEDGARVVPYYEGDFQGRVWRFSAWVWTGAAANVSYFAARGEDASGNGILRAVSSTPFTAGQNWVFYEADFEIDVPTARLSPGFDLTDAADAIVVVDMKVLDVTEEVQAAESASAASISASAASSSQSAAGSSASAASSSASAASTSAGQALNYRNEAATSESNAASSAVAAATSELTASRIAGQGVGCLEDAMFATFEETGSMWEDFSNGPSSVNASNDVFPSGKTLQFNRTDHTLTEGVLCSQDAGWAGPRNEEAYVVEVCFTYVGGTGISGAGIMIDWNHSSGETRAAVRLEDMITGYLKAGVPTWASAVVKRPASFPGGFTNHDAWFMSNYTGNGLGPTERKHLKLHYFQIRAATPEELQNLDTAATVAVDTQTLATLDGKAQASKGTAVTATSGGSTYVSELRQTAYANPDGSGGSLIYLRANNIIVDGTMTANKLAVGYGGNMLTNTAFWAGQKEWRTNASGGIGSETSFSVRSPGASFAGLFYPTLYMVQQGTSTDGYADFVSSPSFDADGTASGQGAPCTPGVKYEASLYVSTHRCTGQLRIQWIDAAGNTLSYAGPATIPTASGSSDNPDTWQRVGIKAVAPTGATYMRIHIRKLGTLSETSSYLFIHKPMLCECPDYASELTPYSPGGATFVDGGTIRTSSLEGDRVAARSMAADRMELGTLTADEIIADGITRQGVAGSGTVTNNSGSWTTIASFTISNMPKASYVQGIVGFGMTVGPVSLSGTGWQFRVLVAGSTRLSLTYYSTPFRSGNLLYHTRPFTMQNVPAGNILIQFQMVNMGGEGVSESNISAIAAMR